MPRKPREEVAGGIHHVFARGNNREAVFRDGWDRRLYLKLLAAVIARQRWRCLAYCLMGNHMHLLLETPEPNLGAGMQRLHGDYARRFNDRHGRDGHVFRGRFRATRVTSDGQLSWLVGYIACNPVKAGLVTDPAAWPWSSHAAVTAGRPPRWLDQGRLAELIGAQGGDAARRYRALASEWLSRPRP
jgi:putative transposase